MSTNVNITPFTPDGATTTITGAVSAPTGVQVNGNQNNSFLIQNAGAVTAFIGIGQSAAGAQAAAVVAGGLPILAGQSRVIGAPEGSFFSAITPSSTASVYVTPGLGN